LTDVFIHVGLQKTGTTALQNVFEQIKGVQYFHYLDWYTKVKPDVDILFSNEDLSGFPIGDKLDRYKILDNLHHVFPKAKIIVGFRKWESWVNSIYKETVRQGYVKDRDAFDKEFDTSYIDFNGYEEEIKKKFRDVYVYQFEDLKENFDKIVKDICIFIDKEVPEYKQKKVNISLNDYQVYGLRCINRWCKSWHNPSGLFPGKIPHRLIGRIRI